MTEYTGHASFRPGAPRSIRHMLGNMFRLGAGVTPVGAGVATGGAGVATGIPGVTTAHLGYLSIRTKKAFSLISFDVFA